MSAYHKVVFESTSTPLPRMEYLHYKYRVFGNSCPAVNSGVQIVELDTVFQTIKMGITEKVK
jgi:hypothetical protein